MEVSGEAGPVETAPVETGPTDDISADDISAEALADLLAVDFERIFGLFRSLSQPSNLSATAAATLATVERNGPVRLTMLAAREGVTQPAMTQLISRLEDARLVQRGADPSDGRVVLVAITDEGRAALGQRRANRADRLAGILAQLPAGHRAALAAALPALGALAAMPRPEDQAPAAPVARRQS